MKKIRIGDAYSNPPLNPNVCVVCGKNNVVKIEQLMLGGLSIGKCNDHLNYAMVLRAGNVKKGEAPGMYEAINLNDIKI
jgi:hypothetical protein